MDVFDRVMAYNAGREPKRLQMKLAAMQADPIDSERIWSILFNYFKDLFYVSVRLC